MNNKTKKYCSLIICIAIIGFILVSYFIKIQYVQDEYYNNFISKIIQNVGGFIVVLIYAKYLNIKLFAPVKNFAFIIPCLIIAINNLQWYALLNGKMQLIHTTIKDYLLFSGYCLSIGLFEEVVFRGIIFTFLLGYFRKDKKGLFVSCVLSSIIFGLMHLFNGFSMGTLLQVCYTTLTGLLFAICYVKTKNILIPAIVHSIYNFCGMLFSLEGLGSGVVFDTGTVVVMAIVDVLVAIYIIYDFIKTDFMY